MNPLFREDHDDWTVLIIVELFEKRRSNFFVEQKIVFNVFGWNAVIYNPTTNLSSFFSFSSLDLLEWSSLKDGILHRLDCWMISSNWSWRVISLLRTIRSHSSILPEEEEEKRDRPDRVSFVVVDWGEWRDVSSRWKNTSLSKRTIWIEWTNLIEMNDGMIGEISTLLSSPIPLFDEEWTEDGEIGRAERWRDIRERLVDQGGTIDHCFVDLRKRIDIEHRQVLSEEWIRSRDSIDREKKIRWAKSTTQTSSWDLQTSLSYEPLGKTLKPCSLLGTEFGQKDWRTERTPAEGKGRAR